MTEHKFKHVSCPSDDTLLAFRRRELAGEEYETVALHLLFCNGCVGSLNALPWEISDEDSGAMKMVEPSTEVPLTSSLTRAIQSFRERHTLGGSRAIKTWNQVQQEGGLKAGQIWRTKSEGIVVPAPDQPEYFSVTELSSRPHLVLITSTEVSVSKCSADYHAILVAPIDADVNYRGDGDLLIKEDDSPLGYSFIVQLWNGQMMLRENLEDCLGEIRPDQKEEVLQSLSLHKDTEPLGGKYSLEAVVLKGLHTDPIMRYRAKEYEETSYLRMPAQSFLDAASHAHEWEAEAENEAITAEQVSKDLSGSVEVFLDNTAQPSSNPLDHLPREIVAAGHKLGLGVTALASRLLGFSVPSLAPARAATTSIELVAELEWSRGGTVVFGLNQLGMGTLQGRFDYPHVVLVVVYDTDTDRILKITEESGGYHDGLYLSAGVSLRTVQVQLPAGSTGLEKLRLIVLQQEG